MTFIAPALQTIKNRIKAFKRDIMTIVVELTGIPIEFYFEELANGIAIE